MLSLPEHWPCDQCLKVETEVISQYEVISLSSAFLVLCEGNTVSTVYFVLVLIAREPRRTAVSLVIWRNGA